MHKGLSVDVDVIARRLNERKQTDGELASNHCKLACSLLINHFVIKNWMVKPATIYTDTYFQRQLAQRKRSPRIT